MRKLKLQVQLSIDGFMAGVNGELDWMTFPWTEDISDYVTKITESFDTIVLGRNLAGVFIPHWEAVAANPEHSEYLAGKKYTDTPKVVFTQSLERPEWNNTVLAKGGLAEEVNKLKQQSGKDIIAYGGSRFVSSLLKESLIDEMHLFINPVIIGKGLPLFMEITERRNYKLLSSRQFDCGIIVLHYQLLSRQ